MNRKVFHMKLEQFANDKYKILKIVFDNEIKVNKDTYTNLNQQEIADIAKFSKKKVNILVNELINDGFLEKFNDLRGKYKLTAEGEKVVNLMQSTVSS